MKKQKALAGHGQVYHAAMGCQAASLSLTAHGLRGEKKACPAKGQKKSELSLFCPARWWSRPGSQTSGSSFGVSQLGSGKGFRVIAGLVDPHTIDNTHPDVGQGPHRHTVTLALRTFALVIIACPGFLRGRLPSKLVQGVTQGFQTGKPFVRFGIIATLQCYRSRPGQHLNTGGISVTGAIISPFSQQTGSQAFASAGKRTPSLVIGVAQKKAFDLLVIGSNLWKNNRQLLDQGEHQARLGANGNRIGCQSGSVQLLTHFDRSSVRVGILPTAQDRGNLCHRRASGGLRRGVGLQKEELAV